MQLLTSVCTRPRRRNPADLGGLKAAGTAPLWKRKLRRAVALLALMGLLAAYLDRDVQRWLEGLLHRVRVVRVQAPEQHGEL